LKEIGLTKAVGRIQEFQERTVMKLGEDLYIYLWRDPGENNCNTYLIRGEVTVLIDPGHLQHVTSLFRKIEEDGISAGEIDVVIVTHGHPDHVEGLQAFFEKPVKIAMNKKEERYLKGNGKFLFEMMGQSPPRIRVDFYLKEGELHLGEKVLNIFETPGHSPGSISIYWPERKALFTGDLVFHGGVGRTDFVEGDPRLLIRSIERLSRLDTEVLLPGHGEIVSGMELVLQNYEFIRQSIYSYL
jgi:glyoxylase-like metal-dependent hydrolase (beta-lactamase superfamily II)